MNLHETIALLEALRASGVTRFKSSEHEIDLSGKGEAIQVKKIEPSEDQTKVVAEANEKLKNLINTINMTPEELANKMFPNGAM